MFNVKLYKDMLKQLRMSGLILTILSILISLYQPISRVLSASYFANFGYGHITKLADVTPVLLFAAFAGGALFPLIAFSFLNKRNSSDYYHSLPNTRVCTFLSIFAAITTWIFIMVVSTVLLTSVVYFACGLGFNLIYIVYLIGAYCASTLLVSAVTSVAMSITGTLFANIIITGLIGFLPRFIIMVISEAAMMTLASVTNIASLGLLNHEYNLPVSFAISIIDINTTINNLLGFKGGILYTFILALLYVVLACFMFHIRKSESADKNAPNRVLQHIYRCAITLPLLLWATSWLVFANSPNSMSWIASLILGAAVYLIYELITTKSVKKMISCSPYFLVVTAISFGLSYSTYFISESILSKTPSSQEIKCVQFVESPISKESNQNGSQQLSQVKFDNVVIKDIVSEQITENISFIREYGHLDCAKLSSIKVLITLDNNKKLYRHLYVPNNAVETIWEIIDSNPAYLTRLRTMPADEDIVQLEAFGMRPTESRELFNSYKQEISQISDEQLLNHIEAKASKDFCSITVDSIVGVKHYDDNFHINEYLPKTAMMHCNIINKRNRELYTANLEYVLSYNTNTATEDDRFAISITRAARGNQTVENNQDTLNLGCQMTANNYTSEVSFEQMKSVLSILKECSTENVDISKPYFSVNIKTPIYQENDQHFYSQGNYRNTMYVQLTNEQLDEIYKIIN